MKKFLYCTLAVLIFISMAVLQAEASSSKGRIIFIPLDNRPISDFYAADTMTKAGYTVIVPPDELLGGYGHMQGNAESVWQWLDNTMQEYGYVNAAVISGDTMLYGSLVGSRTHEMTEQQLLERVAKFRVLHERYPELKLYVFSSIMRTPKANAAYGGAECAYMDNYAYALYRYSALQDKLEIQGLKKKEKQEMEALTADIPQEVMKNWQARRSKNLKVNKAMLDLAREGVFSFFALGRDDNAPLSQTHREARYLAEYGKDLPVTKHQNMTGIDEIGMLLLARAGNNINYEMPFIYPQYNAGAGGAMIPSFAGNSIDKTMQDYVKCAGGFYTKSTKRADLALLVNTTADGSDSFAGSTANTFIPDKEAEYIADLAEKAINSGIPTGIVDISHYNGSDNGLMQLLQDRDMLFKLTVYGGWNTASNSLGFAMAQGMVMPHVSIKDKNGLLMTRYLDEWAYEANIRQQLSGKADAEAETQGTALLREFAKEHLASYPNKNNIRMELPWKRFFENKVILE